MKTDWKTNPLASFSPQESLSLQSSHDLNSFFDLLQGKRSSKRFTALSRITQLLADKA